jgi:regulator of protease activity HflC (stomatin/prohibitin superfamily)
MDTAFGIVIGLLLWFVVRCLLSGFYTIDQNQRGVKTRFGRAIRVPGGTTTLDDPIATFLLPEERARYTYPQVRVIPPGGPYFKMPWERIYKVSIATTTVNMALDPENSTANENGQRLEAVTKDQLNTGLTGQIRYRVSESNLYAYLFGIKKPFVHVMGYFVSVLRQRIANFEAKPVPIAEAAAGAAVSAPGAAQGASLAAGAPLAGSEMTGISINDLRKNLRDLNEYMDQECRCAPARYGVVLDASLITGIDPPTEVESALAAINTAHNQVSSDISLAQAAADQRVVQSRRAVEIETLRAEAEVQPIRSLAAELSTLHNAGSTTLAAYLRNVRLALYDKAQQVYLEVSR